MDFDTISDTNWEGTAEQIAELLAFARDYSWEDTVGTIDAEHAADEILGVIDCAYEDTDEGEGEIHHDARARLRAALIDSAERENARRADPSWGPGDPEYDALPEAFPGVEGGVFMPGVRGLA